MSLGPTRTPLRHLCPSKSGPQSSRVHEFCKCVNSFLSTRKVMLFVPQLECATRTQVLFTTCDILYPHPAAQTPPTKRWPWHLQKPAVKHSFPHANNVWQWEMPFTVDTPSNFIPPLDDFPPGQNFINSVGAQGPTPGGPKTWLSFMCLHLKNGPREYATHPTPYLRSWMKTFYSSKVRVCDISLYLLFKLSK